MVIRQVNGVRSEIDKDTLYNRIIKCSKVLSEIRGVTVEIFPHSIRHARLEVLISGGDTRILDENGNVKKFDIEACKLVAHHSEINTTSGYLKNHDEDMIDEMFGFSK